MYAPLTKVQEDYYKSAVDKSIKSLIDAKNDTASDDCFDALPFSSTTPSSSTTCTVDDDDSNCAGERVGGGSRRKSRRDINYAFFDSGSRESKSMNLMKDEGKTRKVYADESSDEEGDGKEGEANDDW